MSVLQILHQWNCFNSVAPMHIVPMDVALPEWTEFLIPLKGWILPTEHIALFSVFTTLLHDVYLQSSIREKLSRHCWQLFYLCALLQVWERKTTSFPVSDKASLALKLFPRIYDTYTLTNTAAAIIFPSLVSNFTLKRKFCQLPMRCEDGNFCRCR